MRMIRRISNKTLAVGYLCGLYGITAISIRSWSFTNNNIRKNKFYPVSQEIQFIKSIHPSSTKDTSK